LFALPASTDFALTEPGMDLSDTKRLKQLEDENAKLKRLVADVMLDNVVLKDLLGKP
jgi:putative transposase